MRLVLVLIIGLLWGNLPAQSFETLLQEAESSYESEQYTESAIAYQRALAMQHGSALDYYNAACSWALSGDTTQSLVYLQQAAERGWRNVRHIKRDQDLESLRSTTGWQAILVKVQANLDAYNQQFDQPLKNQLEQIYIRDQTLRQLFRTAMDKFGRESEEMTYFRSLVAREDSVNELEVLQIIDEHGWVGTSQVGGRANIALWLVIQHAPLATQEHYLPLLQESVKNGESSGRHLALLEDRILMRNGQPQKYGSQIETDPTTGEERVYEIVDPEYVNQRRAAVGLGPIEEYVKRWNIEWTIEQRTQ